MYKHLGALKDIKSHRRAFFMHSVDDTSFKGDVKINFNMTQSSIYLPLRADNITIRSAELVNRDTGRKMAIDALQVDAKTSEVRLYPLQLLVEGVGYSLQMRYTGTINPPMGTGIYYDNYISAEGQEKCEENTHTNFGYNSCLQTFSQF